jgi:hypothetical protein
MTVQGERGLSIFERALGPDFKRLHPALRAQYGIRSGDCRAFRGRGVMDEVWHGRWYTVPFLHIGAMRSGMFAETGRDVAFSISNYAYRDGLGRETLTWTREFYFDRPRRFDETIVYSERRGRLVVYLGTHQHLAVELIVSVDAEGALIIRTGAQRLYEFRVGLRFPLLFSGVAKAREWWCEDEGRFRVDVSIANPLWGRILGYRGWFEGGVEDCAEVPQAARPRREERRE